MSKCLQNLDKTNLDGHRADIVVLDGSPVYVPHELPQGVLAPQSAQAGLVVNICCLGHVSLSQLSEVCQDTQ